MTKKTSLRVGRAYFGPDEARVTVVALDEAKGKATIQHPLSLRMETWPISRLHKHAAASSRRTYDVDGLAGPERRTKLAAEPDGSVSFRDEVTRREHVVSSGEWSEWRAKAKP